MHVAQLAVGNSWPLVVVLIRFMQWVPLPADKKSSHLLEEEKSYMTGGLYFDNH